MSHVVMFSGGVGSWGAARRPTNVQKLADPFRAKGA
jgi:hypothetical protein